MSGLRVSSRASVALYYSLDVRIVIGTLLWTKEYFSALCGLAWFGLCLCYVVIGIEYKTVWSWNY